MRSLSVLLMLDGFITAQWIGNYILTKLLSWLDLLILRRSHLSLGIYIRCKEVCSSRPQRVCKMMYMPRLMPAT